MPPLEAEFRGFGFHGCKDSMGVLGFIGLASFSLFGFDGFTGFRGGRIDGFGGLRLLVSMVTRRGLGLPPRRTLVRRLRGLGSGFWVLGFWTNEAIPEG